MSTTKLHPILTHQVMSETHFHLQSLTATKDRLTSRGGIANFAQFISAMMLPSIMGSMFSGLKGNSKGVSVQDFFGSVLNWLIQGDSRHISSFEDLKGDSCMAALFKVKEIPGQDAVKRMFKKFRNPHEFKFRDILASLFLRRLRSVAPKLVILGVDSMVLDNDDAECRMGVAPTYKKIKGYHPIQMTWNGMIIDGIFRRGDRYTHEFKQTSAMIRRMVRKIRETLGSDVAIIVSMDAGYCDEKLIRYLDEDLKVGFVIAGKLYKNFKVDMGTIVEEQWSNYSSDNRRWKFLEMGYKCKKWLKYYRAILTQVESREDGAIYLDFARPTSLILTNIGRTEGIFHPSALPEVEKFMNPKELIRLFQGRGAEELCHRALKDFGFEQLPFSQFGANLGMYHCMLIGFAAFELFKAEVLNGVVKAGHYPTTVRRRVIDVAAKITTSSRKLFLKYRDCTMEKLNLHEIWRKSFGAPPLLT
jgi:hypothetical protein